MSSNQLKYLESRIEMHRNGLMRTLQQLESDGETYKYGHLNPNVNLLLWEVIKTEAVHSQYTPRYAITPEITHRVKPRRIEAFPNLTTEELCRIEYIYNCMVELLGNGGMPTITHNIPEDGSSKTSLIFELDKEVPSREIGRLLLEVWKLPIVSPPNTPLFVPEAPLDSAPTAMEFHATRSQYMVRSNLTDNVRVEVHGLSKDFIGAFCAFYWHQYGEYCLKQLGKTLKVEHI